MPPEPARVPGDLASSGARPGPVADPAVSIALRIAAAEMCEIIGARRGPTRGACHGWTGPARHRFDEARARLDARAGDIGDVLARTAAQG